jgi:hypothetical protein
MAGGQPGCMGEQQAMPVTRPEIEMDQYLLYGSFILN